MDEQATLSPEEVETLRNFLNAGQAVTGSLSSSQIAALAGAASEVLPTLQRLASPEVQRLVTAVADSADSLAGWVRTASEYVKAGQLESALELLTLLGVLRAAVGTSTVSSLAETASALLVSADQLASSFGGADGVRALLAAVPRAREQTERDYRTLGVLGLARALKQPGVQRGVKFLLHLLENLGRA